MIADAGYIFTGIVSLLLVMAAGQDIATRQISNYFSLCIFALFCIYSAFFGHEAPSEHALSFVLTSAIMLVVYHFGIMGGGDIKLIAAASIWFGYADMLKVACLITLFGGLLAMAAIMARRALPARPSDQGNIVALKNRGSIPYGVAIASGTIAGLILFPVHA